jgi:Zn-dependent peptidase ImmA (M78 family)
MYWGATMEDFEVDVDPTVLEWARESAKISQADAAKKLGMTPLELQYLEVGVGSPKLSHLQKMVNLYKRPLAVFFLPQPPTDFEAMRNFRLAPGNEDRPYSLPLARAFERVRLQRDVTLELAELSDEVPPPLDLTVDRKSDADVTGEQIRRWLGSPTPQARDAYRRDDLPVWIELVEAKSILVTQVAGVQVSEMRGCSVSDQPFPAIMLNGKDSRRGRVFTLMHELVHILLHAGGICDLEERRRRTDTAKEQIERFCNRVAAAVLMPRDRVLNEPLVARASRTTEWTDRDLRYLANIYGVSQEAMLRRMVDLGRATWDYYLDQRQHFLRPYERQQSDSGRLDYYRIKLRDLGRRYVSTVLDAYARQDITGSEVADYLDIKVNKLPGLRSLLEPR